VVPYKSDKGMAEKKFTIYRTQHGPVVREANGKWVAIRMMVEHIQALEQSYSRTKTHNYKEYVQTMELKANSSNNTIFADTDGDIAYFHGNFIPKRDTSFDWTRPVDGSNPATEWKGLHSLDEIPHLFNPASGWLYNSNNWPWSASGPSSPKKEDYPAYVESGGESARGLHAVRVLQDKKDFTLDSLIAAAYDSYLTWFEKPMPALIKAWDATPESNPLKAKTAEQIALLRKWDLRWAVDSVPTALAIFWADQARRGGGGGRRGGGTALEDAPADQLLQALVAASDQLTRDFGTWKTPWGDINRFQRLNDDIAPTFDDKGASIPVGFPSATWGSLASFGARAYPGTKKWYGTSGNSFVAVVEFGKTVRAKAVTAGGESGNPSSPHFNDQAQRYATGGLRDVYFYRAQLQGHTQREYHPGN
jgi:acyl-homoserine lactone acylase PvdQ